MKLNSNCGDYFETRYKRKPKQWDIDSLIVLYRKAEKRNQIRRQNVVDCQNKILELGYDMVFYRINGSENYIQFEIKDDGVWNRTGSIFDTSDSDIEKRKKKLYYLIDTDIKFELGQEYYELDMLHRCCNCHYKVFNVLCKLIIENIIKPKYPKNNHYNTSICVNIDEFNFLFKWDQYSFKYDSMLKETITI